MIVICFYAFLALRYSLRNKDDDDVCEDLVQMLTDTLNRELIGVGPETVLSKSQLESLQSALEQQVIMITTIITIIIAQKQLI